MSIASHWKNVGQDARTSCRATVIAVSAAGTTIRLLVIPAVLMTLFTFKAEADPIYKKVCKVGANLTALAVDANANACRAIAIASNSQDYQIGCQDTKNENLVILTGPINLNDKSARLTSASLAANEANANHRAADFAECAKFWISR
jgi:hypothetical protein